MSKGAKGRLVLCNYLFPADVLAYMTRENRPFSVNDVAVALQKAHGKTVCGVPNSNILFRGDFQGNR